MIKRHRINFIVISLVGLGLPVYYKVKALLMGYMTWSDFELLPTLIDFIFPITMAVFMVYGYQFLMKRLKQIPGLKHGKLLLALQVLIVLVLALVVSVLYARFFFAYIFPYPVTDDFLLDFGIVSLLIPVLVNGVGVILHYYEKWESESIKAQGLEQENLKVHYEVLKNQVNPHFLFNCFNTLSVLILESQARAGDFLKHLAKVYRFVLEVKEKELIKLNEELTVMQSYVHLMKTRLGDKLSVKLVIPDKFKNYSIPPLTLQILMENALKHNRASAENPLLISIGVTGESSLEFTNNLNKIEEVASTNVGLKNIIERYKYLSDDGVTITQSAKAFSVNVPLINVEA